MESRSIGMLQKVKDLTIEELAETQDRLNRLEVIWQKSKMEGKIVTSDEKKNDIYMNGLPHNVLDIMNIIKEISSQVITGTEFDAEKLDSALQQQMPNDTNLIGIDITAKLYALVTIIDDINENRDISDMVESVSIFSNAVANKRRGDMIKDKQLLEYDLGLVSDVARDRGTIYLYLNDSKDTTKGLHYEIVGSDGEVKNNTIPWDKLPKDFPQNSSGIIQSKDKWFSVLLAQTSKAGDTLSAQIEKFAEEDMRTEKESTEKMMEIFNIRFSGAFERLKKAVVNFSAKKGSPLASLISQINSIDDSIETEKVKLQKMEQAVLDTYWQIRENQGWRGSKLADALENFLVSPRGLNLPFKYGQTGDVPHHVKGKIKPILPILSTTTAINSNKLLIFLTTPDTTPKENGQKSFSDLYKTLITKLSPENLKKTQKREMISGLIKELENIRTNNSEYTDDGKRLEAMKGKIAMTCVLAKQGTGFSGGLFKQSNLATVLEKFLKDDAGMTPKQIKTLMQEHQLSKDDINNRRLNRKL